MAKLGKRIGFSAQEDELIRLHWGKLSYTAIGHLIDRTATSVYTRGHNYLGLIARQPRNNATLSEHEIKSRLTSVESRLSVVRPIRLMLSMVMTDPPEEVDLSLLSDSQLEQAQRWALEQAHYYRAVANGVPRLAATEPVMPFFLKRKEAARCG